jgi:hypothetical protein
MAGTTEERSGWVLFATTVFIVLGVFNTIYGLALLLNHEWLVVTSDTVWYLDISAWGWITLIIAVVQFLVAWGIANAEMWARILGVIAAGLALIGGFATVPYYPWYSITIMVLSAFVIWAVTVHGKEVHQHQAVAAPPPPPATT